MKPFRVMLEPPGKSDSFIFVHVSPTDGAVGVKLADCNRRIQWHFGKPGSARAIRKITKVKAVVDRVYAHLTGGGDMKRIAAALAAAATVCGLAWLAGFNFDSRGPEAFFVAYFAGCAAMAVYLYPGWKR